MTGWITRKASAVVGSIGAGLLGVTSLLHPPKPAALQPIRMQFTYAITYLDPILYDDWETVFIGNHIYPRLFSDSNRSSGPALAKEISVSCSEPVGPDTGPKCRRLQVSFAPQPFTDCAGRAYSVADIRDEFERLLAAKSWAVPDWKRCAGPADSICVTGKNTGDIARRLENVNFRFGWSKRTKQDTEFGAGPYCMRAARSADGTIQSGILVTRDPGANFPKIVFAVGTGKNADFDVSLYGSKELLKGSRRNVQAHTPLAYYAVTNPALAGRELPWNTEQTRTIIRDHFIGDGVFFPQSPEIERLVPKGSALGAATGISESAEVEFAMPDYLPGCGELAAKLTNAWKKHARGTATCVDIVAYVQGKVRERKGRWDGFLVGLSPADPGRDALKLQYFSKDSKDSLTYDSPQSDSLFYLAGIGQSLVTVDGRRVCDLKPNALGLGDIFVTDFLGCER